MAFSTSYLFLVLMILSIGKAQVSAQCNGTAVILDATDATHTFSTPGYPYYYTNNLNCQWKIRGNGKAVLIVINGFSTEYSYDFVSIYDLNSSTLVTRSLLLHHSGSLIAGTWYKSTSGGLYVQFTTDTSVTGTGANFAFVQLPASEVPANGALLRSNSTYQYLMYGSGLYSYVDSTRSWTIRSIDLGEIVEVTVTYRRLINDILYIYDGTNDTGRVLASLTGTDQPFQYTYTSASSNIFIRYSLYYAFSSYEGVIIKYKSVTTSATTMAPTTTTTTAMYRGCGSFSLPATLSDQYIESPGYPIGYSNNLYCTWTLYAANINSSIALTILDMHLEGCCDILNIYDGPSTSYSLLMTSSNTLSNAMLQGSGQSMHLVFSTDGSVIYRGFQLRFSSAARRKMTLMTTTNTTKTTTTKLYALLVTSVAYYTVLNGATVAYYTVLNGANVGISI